jgi:subtilisin family serine protease
VSFIRDLGPRAGDARWRAAQRALRAGRTRIGHIDTGLAPHPALGFKNGAPPPNIHMTDGLNWHDPSGGETYAVATLRKGTGLIEDLTEYPDHGVKTLSVILSDNDRLRGVAPGAHIVPYRVANGPVFRAKATTKNIGYAIDHALGLSHPVRVFSISMGNPGVLGAFEGLRRLLSGETIMAMAARRAIDRAYEAGAIVVCAGGQVIDRVVYPARFSRTIAVGGFKRRGALIEHYPPEGYGDRSRIDVYAMAVDVNRAAAHLDASGKPVFTYADDPNAPGGEPSGTSYATPQVAAAAAMWVETHRDALEAAFAGARWKIVEAFRLALKRSADTAVARGTEGPGTRGEIRILDIERLLATAPDPDHAYRKRGPAASEGVW